MERCKQPMVVEQRQTVPLVAAIALESRWCFLEEKTFCGVYTKLVDNE